MTRQEQLNEAWCKYRGKCSTEIMQALAFALRWCDEHPNWEAIVKRLQEEITNDLRKDRWISVEDELPPCDQSLNDRHGNPLDYAIKVSKSVLVYANGEITIDRLNQDIEYGQPYGKPYWILPVTHWMPLPAPPMEIRGNQGKISPNQQQIIGTADHIKTALEVMDKKGGER